MPQTHTNNNNSGKGLWRRPRVWFLLGIPLGGFLMFFAEPELHACITHALADLQPVTFRFDRTGTQIVFYQPVDVQ